MGTVCLSDLSDARSMPLEGLELQNRAYSTADFPENPWKINDPGLNVIERNELLCPQMWANGGHKLDELTVTDCDVSRHP
jgi:hypothetical protein